MANSSYTPEREDLALEIQVRRGIPRSQAILGQECGADIPYAPGAPSQEPLCLPEATEPAASSLTTLQGLRAGVTHMGWREAAL